MLKNFVKPTSVDICTEEASLWPLEPLFTTPPLKFGGAPSPPPPQSKIFTSPGYVCEGGGGGCPFGGRYGQSTGMRIAGRLSAGRTNSRRLTAACRRFPAPFRGSPPRTGSSKGQAKAGTSNQHSGSITAPVVLNGQGSGLGKGQMVGHRAVVSNSKAFSPFRVVGVPLLPVVQQLCPACNGVLYCTSKNPTQFYRKPQRRLVAAR